MQRLNTKYTNFGLSIAAVVVAAILVTGTVVPALSQAAYAAPTLSSRAMAMSINAPIVTTTIMDTGTLSSSGSVRDAEPMGIQTPLATADGLVAVAMNLDQATSQAAIGEMILLPGTTNQITAYLAYAQSQASCSGVSGYSDITSLAIGGNNIPITGQPNQVVSVPGVLTLTINEQIVSGNSITVNALHLSTPLGTDVIVASASSSASCSPTLGILGFDLVQEAFALGGVPSFPGCIDFVTGGGWVKPPPNKGTFGLVAGFKNGGENPRGNFQYHDHTFDLNVHAEDVLYYHCGQFENSRVFGGHARVNGESGFCYQVFVQDNGEPGKNTDFFSVFVWDQSTPCPSTGNPPTPAMYATGNSLGGGNIQLHTK